VSNTIDPTTATTTAAAATTTTTTTTPKVEPVYRFVELVNDFKPGRGLAAALLAAVTNEPGTVDQLTARLLDSGDYMKFAPQAATLRAAKPIRFWLRSWTKLGVLTTEPAAATEPAAPTTDEPAAPAAPAADQPAIDAPATDAPAADGKGKRNRK